MPATAEPQVTPMTGAQRRRLRVDLSAIPAMTTTVTAAHSGAAVAGLSLRHLGQKAEDGWHGTNRHQHQHGARNGRVRIRRNQTIRADSMIAAVPI